MANESHITRNLMYNQSMKAILNNTIIAESNDTLIVEGNYYFPKESLNMDYFKESKTTTHCPWKGEASYYTVEVPDSVSEDAAWFYREPNELASNIKDHVAFWKKVQVVEN